MTGTEIPSKALVVEDHPEARRWLAAALECAFPDIAVGFAADCAGARSAFRAEAPDIALVDLGLPDGDGVGLVAEFTAAAPECFVVVVTLFDDDEHVFQALRAGARGYLLKDQESDELAAQLRGIRRGQPPLSPAVARRLMACFAPQDPPEDCALTQREREVLTLIAKGMTLAEVAGALGISRHTAAGYTKDIYRKLKVASRAEAALEAARRGIVVP